MPEPTTDGSQVGQAVAAVPVEHAMHFGVLPWREVAPRLPLLPFFGMYVATCYVGTMALLASERFRATYAVFSGAQGPSLSWWEIARILVLLHAGPLLLWAGYELALRWGAPRLPVARERAFAVPAWLPRVFMALPIGFAFWSLSRAGAWQGFAAWNDYNTYVHARLRLFDTLSFFEFVNLYTWLPLAAAYMLLAEKRRWMAVASVLAVLLLQYPLAQRKVLLTSTLLVLFAIYVHDYVGTAPRHRADIGRHARSLALALFTLYAIYIGLTFQSVARPDSKPYTSLQNVTPQVSRTFRHDEPDAVVSFGLDERTVVRLKESRGRALALYLLFAPLTRTSITAITYPVIFPGYHPFYPIDLGIDVLGIGRMPDDNQVVYRFLWPEHDRGAVAAPFHIALYSQGGLLVACLGSLLVGFVLALAWSPIAAVPAPTPLRSLAGALLMIAAMFLAMDAARNTILVSYGILWGMLAVFAAARLGRVVGASR